MQRLKESAEKAKIELSTRQQTEINLPYISENGSVINGLNIFNQNFPDKIILSREKSEILKIFETK